MIVFGLFLLIASYAHVNSQEIIQGPPGEYGSEYILIKETLTLHELVAKCTSLGARLATPKTEAEVDFVTGHAQKHMYLGAEVEKVSGKCVAKWSVDGSEVTNAEWHPWFSTCDGDQTCVGLGSNKLWYQDHCVFSYPQSLCQRKTMQEQMIDLMQRQDRMTLALTNMERQQEKSMERVQEMIYKNDQKSDSLSSNVNRLAELMKKMSTEFNEYKKKVDYLYG